MAQQETKGTIVFFSMDALGHIHPILSIVKALRKRNYRAIILTMRPLSIAPKLRASGFELECCQDAIERTTETETNLDDSKRDKEAFVKDAVKSQMDLFRQGATKAFEATYYRNGAVGKYFDDLVENSKLIEAKLTSLKPDVILVDHVVGVPFVAKIAQLWVRLYSGFPSALYSSVNENYAAGLGLSPGAVTREWKQFELNTKLPIRDRMRLHWRAEGCDDWPLELDLAPTSPYLNFYLGPDELGLHHVDSLKPLPDVWFRLEHTIEVEKSENEFIEPEKLRCCPGKLIYFSLGTLVACDSQLINRFLEMFSRSPNKFIISMGTSSGIKLFPNMWGDTFVDQKAILPKVDLFITHGGHNSIIEAFYYGVPGLIVLPIFADQFDSAQRVQDCGFGLRLDAFNCTESELLTSIDTLLSNDQLKQRMRSIGDRLRSIKYPEIAADKLEQLIASR